LIKTEQLFCHEQTHGNRVFFELFRTHVLFYLAATGRLHQQEETLMFNLNAASKILVTTAALTVMSGAVLAESTADKIYAAEIDACVTALKANIEMDGVRRIRHVVTKLAPDSIGYKMTLQTSTFTDDGVREYTASCFANGNNPPIKLRIRERNS
jgi:hypothetical protein